MRLTRNGERGIIKKPQRRENKLRFEQDVKHLTIRCRLVNLKLHSLDEVKKFLLA